MGRVSELEAKISQAETSEISDLLMRESLVVLKEVAGHSGIRKKWLRKSEQGDKWNRCLIEGMIVLSETGARDEQTTPP